jgi:hypothetical protein
MQFCIFSFVIFVLNRFHKHGKDATTATNVSYFVVLYHRCSYVPGSHYFSQCRDMNEPKKINQKDTTNI